ncbi:pyridoxal phosphate-dependent aminotransferase [Roseivirga sp. BDSF3-8]|uniref:pyridoxal phosphate-dependent aminotransferase n=1 Tax=Roseivirga sp. BDSF3-8 TaxID=3241598 RepID=UPI003531FF44
MSDLSLRIRGLAESATIAMAQKAREFKARGIDLISLSLGEPDFKTPDYIREAAIDAINDGSYFSYPPVPGYQDLREAIAEKLKRDNGIETTAANIVVSTGAKQSIANVMLCLLDPGDEVVVFSPYWVSYAEIIKVAEGTPVFVHGGIENDFKVTPGQLEEAITPKTKAIIYSSPCNPTGTVFTQSELEAFAEVVKRHEGVYVIADEIYELINFSGGHASMAAIPGMGDRTITVNGFSKGYAMTGWRVGYISAPLEIAKACNKMQGQFTSATNGIAQRAALAALRGDQEPTKKMAEAYLERRDMVLKLLADIPGIQANTPQGAFYVFPNVSSYFGKSYEGRKIDNATDLCMYLLEEAHVSLVTGEAFGAPDCLRISYAASVEELKEAFRRIAEALGKLN